MIKKLTLAAIALLLSMTTTLNYATEFGTEAQAKAMIEETLLPLVEVAVATGFASICAMSKTVRDEYGASPSKMRDRKKIRLLTFAE